MNILDYSGVIEFPEEIRSLRWKLMREMVPELAKMYGSANEIHVRTPLIHQMTPVLFALSEDYKGKTFLDLGCGSNTPELGDRVYEPWLCRALHHLGVNAIGIDLGELDGEQFTHHQTNLLERDSLRFLPDNSVDVANARQLFTSPLYLRHFMEDNVDLWEHLIPQLERIVKPEGTFMYKD